MKYIIEISQAKTFSKASENLHISQPGLSKAVKSIENKLGFKIFKKIGRKNRLTEQGIELLEIIKPVLLVYNTFGESLKEIEKPMATINFGVVPIYCTPFTTMFLYEFKKKYPAIRTNFIEFSKEVLLEKLLNGEIDVAMTENQFSSNEISTYSAFQDDVAVAVGPKNLLYNQKKVAFDDLQPYSFNFVSNSDILKKQIYSGCLEAGYTPEIGYESSQIGMLLNNTVNTNSICILNRPMIYDNIDVNDHLEAIKIIPLSRAPQCYCYVSYRKKKKITKDMLSFLDDITKELTTDTMKRIV